MISIIGNNCQLKGGCDYYSKSCDTVLCRITAAVTMLEAAPCGEDTAGETQSALEVSDDECQQKIAECS